MLFERNSIPASNTNPQSHGPETSVTSPEGWLDAGAEGIPEDGSGNVSGAVSGVCSVITRHTVPVGAGKPHRGAQPPPGAGRIAENVHRYTVNNVIAYLRGTARAKNIVDVDGVGYLVHCATPLVPGTDVELHVHTQVRDDAITLYGFADQNEKTVFEALTKVTGVGPTSALLLLAGLGAGGVVDAIGRRDAKMLSSVKGIGGKVAEKILTLIKLPETLTVTNHDPRTAEIVAALVSLGFDRKIALDAADTALRAAGDGADEARILADAINHAQNKKAQS